MPNTERTHPGKRYKIDLDKHSIRTEPTPQHLEVDPHMDLVTALYKQVVEDLSGQRGQRARIEAQTWLYGPEFEAWWSVLPGDVSIEAVQSALLERAGESPHA